MIIKKNGTKYEKIIRKIISNSQFLCIKITNGKLKNTINTYVYIPCSAIKFQVLPILQIVLDDSLVAQSYLVV